METTLPLDLEGLLSDAVAEALKHEDPERFLAWCRRRVPRYIDTPGPPMSLDDDPALALAMGRAIWNAIPLPGNGFKRRPLPVPGRNDPCVCGSGRKYKRCCGNVPTPPPISAEVIWPYVLERLPKARLEDALARQQIPASALVHQAERWSDEGQIAKSAALLERLFGENALPTDHLGDFALTLLCNAYDELGHVKKKMALLQRIIDTAPRSPLRSGAWQRLAANRMDADDSAGAWAAVEHARQDDPDGPDVGLLEVHLLVSEERLEEARERAAFWLKRLRRMGYRKDERALEFLSSVAKDPAGAMAAVSMEMAGGAGERLKAWIDERKERPLPACTVVTEAVHNAGLDPEAVLERELRGMGFTPAQIKEAVAEMERAQRAESSHTRPPEGEPPGADSAGEAPPVPETLFLVPPPAVQTLEERWRDISPVGKPFSIGTLPDDDEDPWEPDVEAEWSRFLAAHPGAWDSVDILDDLATAVMVHPQFGSAGLDRTLLVPLLERAVAIVEHALKDQSAPHLLWPNTPVRPALRPYSRLIEMHRHAGRMKEALRLAQRLLALNPLDNHGYRGFVINDALRHGRDAEAEALAARYSEDAMPDILYGRALALFRLRRWNAAEAAVIEAVKHLPKIVRHLTAARVRKPKLYADGVRFGGDDQAWLYREEMRAVWLATPGALDWLKKTAARLPR